VFGNVVLVSGLIRQGRIIVGTFSARTNYCRDLFEDFDFVTGRVRRGRVIVFMSSVVSANCRDVFDQVGFVGMC